MHLDKIDTQLERITKAVASNFTEKAKVSDFDKLHGQVNIYARAIYVCAKQLET